MRQRHVLLGVLLVGVGFVGGQIAPRGSASSAAKSDSSPTDSSPAPGGVDRAAGSLASKPQALPSEASPTRHGHESDASGQLSGELVTPAIRVQLVDAVTGEAIDPAFATSGLTATWQQNPFVPPGKRVLSIAVESREGWMAWENTNCLASPLPGVQTLLFTYPLHRTFSAIVTVLDASEHPVEGAEIERALVGDRSVFIDLLGMRGPTDEQGQYRLGKVPFVPGADVAIDIEWVRSMEGGAREEEGESATGAAVHVARGKLRTFIPDSLPTAINWTVRLATETVEPDPRVDGSRGGGITGVGGGAGAEVPRATIRVRAVRRDGRPASGAVVRCNVERSVADQDGRVAFTWAGHKEVELGVHLVDPSLVPMSRRVQVPPGATVDVELREPEAGRLRVKVVDASGGVARCARLEVDSPSGLGPWDLQGTALRVDPYTDAAGTRVYNRVEPGPVTVTASWLGNEGRANAEVPEGDEATVVVRLGHGPLRR